MMYQGRRDRRVALLTHILIALMICGAVQLLHTENASAATSPKGVSLSSVTQDGTTLTVKWKAVAECTGYQIQYADNRFFMSKKTKKVNDPTVTKKKISGIVAEDTYYVRIRSYSTDEEGTAYSAWTVSGNVTTNKTIKVTPMRKLLKKFEIRRAAKQKVPGFDTVQGSCYGKGYAYFLMENRNIAYYYSSGALKGHLKPRCKIVKIRLSDMSVVKVSGALPLSHGNDMTFDTKRNRLVVSHSTPVPKYVSIVNPNTLKVMSTREVKISKKLEGLPRPSKNPNKYYNYYNGFGCIAYNEAHDQYVAVLRGEHFHHLLFMDGNLKPVRFQYLGTMANQTLQGIDSYGEYIMVAQSYSSGKPYNNILVYDWDGNLLSKLTISKTYELESVFHAKGTLYVSYYTSFYKYKILKKKYVLQRDNYLYKVSGY